MHRNEVTPTQGVQLGMLDKPKSDIEVLQRRVLDLEKRLLLLEQRDAERKRQLDELENALRRHCGP